MLFFWDREVRMSDVVLVNVDECVKLELFFLRFMKKLEFGVIVGVIFVIIFFLVIVDEVMFSLFGIMNFMILVV